MARAPTAEALFAPETLKRSIRKGVLDAQRLQASPDELRRASARTRRPRKRKEASIEQSCIRHAQSLGWGHRKMNGTGHRSWPDRVFTPPRKDPPLKGYVKFVGVKPVVRPLVFVEFKRPGEDPTPQQADNHQELRARGQLVYVCRSLEEFKEVLRGYAW